MVLVQQQALKQGQEKAKVLTQAQEQAKEQMEVRKKAQSRQELERGVLQLLEPLEVQEQQQALE